MSTFAANNNVRVYKDKRLTMKKYMMKGLAAVALLIAAAGCSHDSDYTPPTNEEALQNATEKLGISIDPNQDWSMTASLEATISVDLGLDDAYTVAVYDKNPLYTNDVHYYAKTQMKEGETTTLKLDVPSADSTFYVAVYDSKFRRLVQSATIDEGKLNVAFGTSSNNARMTRAAESEYTGTYAKTAGDYLDGLTEVEMAEYEAFTDGDIDGNGFIFGNSTMNSRAFGMKRSAQVWGGGIIRIQPGFNPKDGESVYMYNGEYRVGKLTFGGTGSAAVADNSKVFNVIVKGDVLGSVTSVVDSLKLIDTGGEITLNIVSSGVGDISENDVYMAAGDNTVIYGFNVSVPIAGISVNVDVLLCTDTESNVYPNSPSTVIFGSCLPV